MSSSVSRLLEKPFIQLITVLLLVFLTYRDTLDFGFVLDDDLIIQNSYVQQGIAGIDDIFKTGYLNGFNGESFSYRPIPLISFALEQYLFELNPFSSHFIQLLIYALLVFMVLKLVAAWFPSLKKELLWAMVLLFLVHPIHTEVVANLKSRDELLAALFVISTLWMLASVEKPSVKLTAFSFVSSLFAFMSKESAVALLIIAPLSLHMLKNEEWKRVFVSSAGIFMAASVYLLLRMLTLASGSVPQEQFLINNAFIEADFLDRLGNSAVLFWMYVYKSLVPLNLTWDYSYSTLTLHGFADLYSMLGLVVLVLSFILLVWKYRTLKTYLFLWLAFASFLATVLNLFVLIGANFAERFLLLPSLFAVLTLVLILKSQEQKVNLRKWIYLLLVILMTFWFARTIDRVKDWESNETLFAASLKTNPESARVQIANGSIYREKAEAMPPSPKQELFYKKAIDHYEQAIQILPSAFDAWYNKGVIFQRTGREDLALDDFQKVIEINPKHVNSHNNIGVIFFNRKELDQAEFHWKKAFELQPNNPDVVGNLGVIAHTRGDYETARRYYQKTLELNPNQPVMIQNLDNLNGK